MIPAGRILGLRRPLASSRFGQFKTARQCMLCLVHGTSVVHRVLRNAAWKRSCCVPVGIWRDTATLHSSQWEFFHLKLNLQSYATEVGVSSSSYGGHADPYATILRTAEAGSDAVAPTVNVFAAINNSWQGSHGTHHNLRCTRSGRFQIQVCNE